MLFTVKYRPLSADAAVALTVLSPARSCDDLEVVRVVDSVLRNYCPDLVSDTRADTVHSII